MSKLYNFTVEMCGWGDNPDEAWENCKENFDIDREDIPESEIIDSDDDDEQ